MESNGKLIREMESSLREHGVLINDLQASFGKHDAMIKDMQSSHKNMQASHRFMLSLFADQVKDARETRKMVKRQDKFIEAHELRLGSIIASSANVAKMAPSVLTGR